MDYTGKTERPERVWVITALLSVYILWGSTYLAIRVALESFPPFFMAGFRFFVTGLLLYLALRLKGVKNPSRSEWAAGGVVGVLLLSLFTGESLPASPSMRSVGALLYLMVFGALLGFSAYTYLINRVRPALATSYAYVNPVIAVTIGVLIAGEKVTAAGFAAMLVIVAAVMMVIFGREAPLKSD